MNDARAGREPHLTTGAERDLAVEHWLLSAAQDVRLARAQWQESGVALLRCSTLFGAVRVAGEVVHSAAGTSDPVGVSAFLARVLEGGPVVFDRASQFYAVLVGPSVGRLREWATLRHDDAEYVGQGRCLAVPPVTAKNPDGFRVYWSVPMSSPGELAPADAVSRLLATGRHRPAPQERPGLE
ncbi:MULTISPECIES: hypothetical protein [Streptomyces]|uniref:hypothetical protein n=1 Tax=Streptomyces TaxID=1883 RepID=UPI003CEFEDD2